jgi:protein-disulfide isomerase
MDTEKKSIFDALNPKQSFVLGGVATVLVLGTIGCLALGGYIWKNSSISATNTETNTAAVNSAGTGSGTGTTTTPSSTTTISGTLAPVDSSDHVYGTGDIAMVVYSDFQCPYCQRFDASVQQVMNEYKGKVKVVFRNFPLSFHTEAQNAAEAAECAGKQGKFWEYAAKLFENQSSLGEELYSEIAVEVGLSGKTFASCRASDETLADIAADQATARSAGVSGTPASFIVAKDGSVKQIKGGAVPFSTLKSVIDAELAK